MKPQKLLSCLPIQALIWTISLSFIMPGTPASAAPVSEERVEEMVLGWLGDSGKVLSEQFSRDIKDIAAQRDEAGTIIYYVVSFHPEGYVIAAADDLISPVIAFSASGGDRSPRLPFRNSTENATG